jgi:hypothetical protein
MPADLSRPISVSYTVQGFNRVDNSLRKLAHQYRREIDSTVGDWTKRQRGRLKGYGYPSQTNKPQPFKTERQRKYFFWALSQGIIQVPYPRTGTFANSWRSRQNGWADWVLENSTSYGALVAGRGQQAKYHQGNWWIAEDIVEEETPELTKKLTDEIVGLAK